MTNRRSFLQQSSALVGGTMLTAALSPDILAAWQKKISPGDRLMVGAIGVNGMGFSDLTSALKVPGVQLAAVCDVDKNVLDKRMADLTKMKIDLSGVQTYNDYRRVLDRKDIDFVIIGTPDHWHALIMMEACQAGKDVYVEKPVGNSIGECRAMVAAQQKYHRVVQAGQWQRSQQHFKDAIDFVYTGQLGTIRTVKVWCYQGWMKPDIQRPDGVPPPGLDYEKWLGPAPKRPYNAGRVHFNFRWFWDYAGGLMTDWGVHLLDYGLLGMKADVPKAVSALGGKFAYPDLYEETPDTLLTIYEFDGFNLLWDHAMGIDNGSYGRDHGVAFIGNNATLILGRWGWEVLEERKSRNKISKPLAAPVDNGLDLHWVNFVNVMRSRNMEDLHCSIADGAHVATVAQMGNISFRSGQRLVWDRPAGQFTDAAINAKYLMKEYNNGYRLPIV
ncbi:MAG TPA: Gfo/Idh/MocA family oxidoreductase [Puia sp.]|nr:Gfo/Idh/MocA family oxidoreductase [Puia sp.]